MDNALVLDEKTLKRIPSIFTLLFILLLACPAIALNYFSINFSTITKDIDSDQSLGVFIVATEIRRYFIQVLLQWSAFSLSAITTLLAFTQYRLTNDKIALIIGLTILFSGTVEAMHTGLIDGLTPYIAGKENIDAIIWTFTNSVSGLILIIGLLLYLKYDNSNIFRLTTFTFLNVLLVMLALAFVYYSTLFTQHPTTWFKYSLITRPYELIYLSIYLLIIFFLYPKTYKKNPSILTNCIFFMCVAQAVIAIYLMFLSNSPYDSAFNIVYFLKVVVYFVPFSCLIINYVFSYNSILKAQNRLQISQERLRYIASHDVLTDLYNRREFEILLDKTIANYARDLDSLALFLIDIDNFKSINDTLGHIHGDSFLKKFSEQLTLLTREGDIISRIGGDEFTVIMSKLKSPTSARKLADRLIEGLNIPYLVNDTLLTGTVSVGIAIYPIDGTSTAELLRNADTAMYHAKKSGKNTYRFYTEKLGHEQRREAKIEYYLQEAIHNDELTLVYQPQYDLVSRQIIGAEILLRWHNEHLGDISPEEFIPVAEQSNLIITIGEWVLSNTCKQAKYWREKYKRDLLFSINISPAQFKDNQFYLHLKRIIGSYNFPPNSLCIEITENLLIDNNERINLDISNINTLGIRISLDDFGMGHSSLRRLKTFPLHLLKIDKLFVADIQNEKDNVFVIDTIIKLAQELGINTIAEGIENQKQLNYLISKECLLGQGIFLSKPLYAAEFEKIAYSVTYSPEDV